MRSRRYADDLRGRFDPTPCATPRAATATDWSSKSESPGLPSRSTATRAAARTASVHVKDDKVVREEVAGPMPGIDIERTTPDHLPMGCNKGAAWSAQSDAADRVLSPPRGESGSGQRRVGHVDLVDEALDEVADTIIDTIETEGGQAVLEGDLLRSARRAWRSTGFRAADRRDRPRPQRLDPTTSPPAITSSSLGSSSSWQDESDLFNSDVLLFWHTNPTLHLHPLLPLHSRGPLSRLRGGALRSDVSPSHTHADYHVPVKWGATPR